MDFYMTISLIMIAAVIAVLVVTVRLYMKNRQVTGYRKGAMYNVHQHMGGYIGNYNLEELGVKDLGDREKVDSDEEMYVFHGDDSDQASRE